MLGRCLSCVHLYQFSARSVCLKKLWPRLSEGVQWLVGNGNSIRFWRDNWLGETIASSLNYVQEVQKLLNDKVSCFIANGRWNLPSSFCRTLPTLAQSIHSIELPEEPSPDQVIWSETASGSLTSSDAYNALDPPTPGPSWCKHIWHAAIQPRKSVTTWKVLHGKIQTDDFLQIRGTCLCSRCLLCGSNSESRIHLFQTCEIASSLWHWLRHLFRLRFPPGTSLRDFFLDNLLSSLDYSSRLLWYIVVCNLLWCIWQERNKIKFDGGTFCLPRFKQFFTLSLRESVRLIFASSSRASTAAPIFGLLGISPLRPMAPRYIPVTWTPPPENWFKANSDGSFRDPNHAGFGGIFRNSEAAFLGAFSCKAIVPWAIDTELLAVMAVVKVARDRNWFPLWLETDSMLVMHYLKNPSRVPWRLRTRWKNCVASISQLQVHISHIYREGNRVADKLANFGATNDNPTWWDSIPPFLLSSFGHDYSAQMDYRFR
ncbi:putative ribonuclease H-like domain, reverse transcriptase zinc-binding domain-containing protein [Rosa chinensis]|uniref:Putative ribonuclease H-like domain, reverse transcriptase zinc-binding domain-containing protein n=1 Tax=Rosa chinensis TaxID=74649 RepID=A0A2P6S4G7_ROSCH|nr:putative ribonuclease H-like domain, reverse transcriptase zinc-binding domain-containing protein [Rosa chinensis]